MPNKKTDDFLIGDDSKELTDKYSANITKKGFYPAVNPNSRLKDKVKTIDMQKLAQHLRQDPNPDTEERLGPSSQEGPRFFAFEMQFAQWGMFSNSYYVSPASGQSNDGS